MLKAETLEFLYRNRSDGQERWIPYLTHRRAVDWDVWRLVYDDGSTAPRNLSVDAHLAWVGNRKATWRRSDERPPSTP